MSKNFTQRFLYHFFIIVISIFSGSELLLTGITLLFEFSSWKVFSYFFRSDLSILKSFRLTFPFVSRKKSKQRRVSLRARPQSVGHMEVLSLLPVSSWTVLVSLVTQELSNHPHGSDEKWRDEEGVAHLTAAPVHQAKFLPTNTSVQSISCRSKQADCVYGRGRG